MEFRSRADDGPLLVVFGPSSLINLKNIVGPPLTKLSGSAHADPQWDWLLSVLSR